MDVVTEADVAAIVHGAPSGDGRPRSMVDLLANPPERVARLLEPALMVEQGITVLAAPTKVGKTNWWLHVAWALTEGGTLWRLPGFGGFSAARPIPVLMIQLELSEPTLYERLAVLRDHLGWSEEAQARFSLRCQRSLQLDRRNGPENILRLIESCPVAPEVVILDSYNAAVVGDPDKSGDARRALHALRKVQEQTCISWGITAEIRKAPTGSSLRWTLDDLKGSNDVAYDADSVLMLRPDRRTRKRLAVHFAAMRHLDGEEPEGLVLIRQGLSFEAMKEASDTAEDEEQVAKVIRDHLAAGGDDSWRACQEAVRKAGIRIQSQVFGDIRRHVLAKRGETI